MIPQRLRTSLYDFQSDGVQFVIEHGGRALIGDEMGLGKTIQAIASAAAFREAWPVLIVVPAVVKLNWAEELEMWLSEIEPGQIHVLRGRSDIDDWKKPQIKFVIATYGLFTNTSLVAQHVLEHEFQFVIVDESHYLKSQSAARTQLLVPIISQAKHAVLLSGTPALARPVELYPQVSSIQPDLFGTYNAFTKKFCNARRGRFGWDVSGASNLDELSVLLQNVMIRRKKNKVLTQLPEKIKKRVPIELYGKAAKELRPLMDTLKSTGALVRMLSDGSSAPKTDREANSIRNEHRRLLMRAYQLTSEAKMRGVKEYVESFLGSSDDKVIVFAHHISMLDSIEESLASNKKRIQWMRIDGSTPHSERTSNAKKFQENTKCRVALVGMTSGGIGITLTAASHVFFAELHWTPGVLQQAEDRAHRIGQTRTVQVHYLIGKGSLDDQLWKKIVSKTSIVSSALEGKKQRLIADMMKGSSSKKKSKKRQRQEEDDPVDSFDNDRVVEAEEEEEEEQDEEEEANVEDDDDEDLPRGDLRSFFRNSQSSSQSNSQPSSSPSSIKTLSAKKRRTSGKGTWSCGFCTLLNKSLHLRCAVCGYPKKVTSIGSGGGGGGGGGDSVSISGSSSSSSPGRSTNDISQHVAAQPPTLYFSVSMHSGRIFLYDHEKVYMGESFYPSEVQNEVDSNKRPVLHNLLHGDSNKRGEVLGFVDKWSRLRSIEQVTLCTHIIRPPLVAAFHRIKTNSGSGKVQQNTLSFVRYSVKPSKNNSASSSSSSSSSTSSSTSSSSSSAPAKSCCVQCGNTDIDLLPSGTCSWKCHQELAAKLSGSSIRRQLFELEKGVCVLCKRDMHALYQRFIRLQPSDRVQECMTIKMKLHETLLQSPNEGMFWQADHVLPVSEGGGECTMENIRTLCTGCHQKETAALRRRLRDAKLGESASGSVDIRGFFGKKTTTKRKRKQAKPGEKRVGSNVVGVHVVDLTL
jgi:superfamily II DNA or RNA helicase/5-methylcytosine-specific restriction endonuclease McrA